MNRKPFFLTWPGSDRWSNRVIALAMLALLKLCSPTLLFSQTYTVVHAFIGAGDGGHPGNIISANGTLYGGTSNGGSFNWGALFRLDSSGKFKVLHNFTGGDGVMANTQITLANQTIYGVTRLGGVPEGAKGGEYGDGEVYKLSQTQKLTVLYALGGYYVGDPQAPLTVDDQGNIYGAAVDGSDGFIFKLDASGSWSILHRFSGPDGAYPNGGLLQGSAGDLYGTTAGGGQFECGVIFKLSSSGRETVLYNFEGAPDGSFPSAGLTRAPDGSLYGTTASGGNTICEGGCGTVFQFEPTGNERIVYEFTGSPDGQAPSNGVELDAAGNIYGTTSLGGLLSQICEMGCGTVFKIASTGHEKVLHAFTGGSDGNLPNNVLLDALGDLYGSTTYGGTLTSCPDYYSPGCGVLFKLNLVMISVANLDNR